MSGRLTTHVLDTARGMPAADVPVTVVRVSDGAELVTVSTNVDGRTDEPLLEGTALAAGTYELRFDIGGYFQGLPGVDEPPFLSRVAVRFTVTRPGEHYHVPLLVSPWSYTTYRGG